MTGKNQTSSTTKNQGGHRKGKNNKASKQFEEQTLAKGSPAVSKKKQYPNLGDISHPEQGA